MATTGPLSTASSSPSVLLINPPSPPGLTANREGAGGLGAWSTGAGGFLYPPHTLACCAAILRAREWEVHLLDAAGERLSQASALAQTVQSNAAIIAVQVSLVSLDNDIAFLNELRQQHPRSRIIAVGAALAVAAPVLLERTDVDHVLLGEPEAMLPAACQATTSASAAQRLRRTVTAADVSGDGMVKDGRVLDLDSLPYPAWDLAPRQRYGFLTLFAGRGCPDVCSFCPYVVGQGHALRERRPQAVVDEMRWLAATYEPTRVIVRDPVFAARRERVAQICRGLIDAHLGVAWECESRPEHFDRELLRLLRRAGCTTVKLGFETTSQSTLRAVQRIEPAGTAQAYVDRVAAVVAACRDVGIACRLFVMTGLPGQTDDDVAETISFLRLVRPSAVHVKPFHRYAGLPLPVIDLDEEKRRGEQQAALLSVATADIAPASSLWRRARRWLRQRMAR